MAYYVKRAWPNIIPDDFQHNWHIDAVCEHLEAVATGDITRLLINVPPGTSKSTLANVMFPSWLWGPFGDAGQRFIGASHEQGLAVRDNRGMRNLVTSDWYQRLWPITLRGDQNEKLYFENEAGGFRQACAVASMTGRRGHKIIWDDPLSPEKAHSQAARETAIRILTETVPTRLNDPKTSAIVVVMQRLHDNDPSGHILQNDLGYTHLRIPMEYEPANACVTSIGWKDPRKDAGELLDPVRFPQEVIDRDKKAMGAYAWAGQMQQRPAPLEGGLVKLSWFKRYTQPPAERSMIVHSWDTASKANQHNDPSVCTVWQVDGNKAYLLDMYRKRVEYPDLKRAVTSMAQKYTPDAVVIEDKASGQALIQDLRKSTALPIIAMMPDADKITRMVAQSGAIESGLVYIPDSAAWLIDFEHEMASFPNAQHDDIVDSVSQFLKWLKGKQKAVAPRIRRL